MQYSSETPQIYDDCYKSNFSFQTQTNTDQHPPAPEGSIYRGDGDTNQLENSQISTYGYSESQIAYSQAASVLQNDRQRGGEPSNVFSSESARYTPIISHAYEDNTTGEIGNPCSSSLQVQMTLGVENPCRPGGEIVQAAKQNRVPIHDYTRLIFHPQHPQSNSGNPCCNIKTCHYVRQEGFCNLCTYQSATSTSSTQHEDQPNCTVEAASALIDHFQRTEPIVEMCPHSRYRPPQYPLHATKKNSDPALQARTYQQSTTGPPTQTYYQYVASPNQPDELSEFTHCETLEEEITFMAAWNNPELNESFY